MQHEIMLLSNLTCPSCAADLEKALNKMTGVKNASVTFATGTLDIEYDGAVVGAEHIERTLARFGVTIASRV